MSFLSSSPRSISKADPSKISPLLSITNSSLINCSALPLTPAKIGLSKTAYSNILEGKTFSKLFLG